MSAKSSDWPETVERYRELLDHLDHAVVWEASSETEAFLFVSKRAALVTGHDAGRWRSEGLAFLERHTHDDDRAAWRGMLRCAAEGTARVDHRIRRPDGTFVWGRTGVAYDPQKGLLRGVTIDVGAVKEAEEREHVARVALEGVMRSRENILAVVSHDLRNPLNNVTIGTATAIRLLEADDVSGARKRLAMVERATRHLERLLDDLVDYSRVQAGRLTLTRDDASIAELVDDALQACGYAAEQRGVALRSKVEPELRGNVDAARLRQVLVNLIENAVRHTPKGGHVDVAAFAEGNDLRLVVRDTGVGIAPEHHERIFDSYYQAPGTSTREGRGLGLFIVRGIAQAHGGRVLLESDTGKGAAFTIDLPGARGGPGE